jgi:hypothetical protein
MSSLAWIALSMAAISRTLVEGTFCVDVIRRGGHTALPRSADKRRMKGF